MNSLKIRFIRLITGMAVYCKLVVLTAIFCFLVPYSVSAHAVPVSMSPGSSEILESAPKEVSISFSERIDTRASAISITGPSGVSKEPVTIDPLDPRTLRTGLKISENGTYLVSWSVVSSDDGHFTKGAYAFAVGKGAVIAASTQNAEVVTISTASEAFGMTIELLGNGLIWAVIFLMAFAIRPLKNSQRLRGHEDFLREWMLSLMCFAGLLVFTGAALQLYIKSEQLASLHTSGFWGGLMMYIGTTAGSATLYRVAAVLAVFSVYVFSRNRIFASSRFTVWEGALVLGMGVFALFRAVVSHATANHFLPTLSVAFNFLHVVEKDVWAGLALVLALLAIQYRRRALLIELLPRISAMLSIDFGLVSATAAYIVWLHLKSFDNLFTTQWGTVCIQLLAAAVLLVAIRIYHVFTRLWKPGIFSKGLSLSLGAEFAAALLVLYYSSIVIITSPPLAQPSTPVFSANDQGVRIELSVDPYEDGKMLLSSSGGMLPDVRIENPLSDAGAASVELEKRFDGGYVFPLSLLSGQEPRTVSISAPQEKGYDGHAVFEIPAGAYTPPEDWEARRTLDVFTLIMAGIAVSALIAAYVLYLFTRRSGREAHSVSDYAGVQSVAGFLLVSFVAGGVIASLASIANPFKARCVADGNMWHLMQPMKAGKPLAAESMEGCMWGTGSYQYMFADQREYEYYAGLPQAIVSIDRTSFEAGKSQYFTISIKEPDGAPAKLFVDMTKLLHVVIVSRDQTVFSHIHADDSRALTKEEIESSAFRFRYTFPKSGEYLISADYAHGVSLESKQFIVKVSGEPEQQPEIKQYPESGVFDGYEVKLTHAPFYAGDVSTLQYSVRKDGKPVTDMVPYLDASMHISVVMNDLSGFIHTHGEVHLPGQPVPPTTAKNGKIVHSMAAMTIPPQFGPNVEAHLIFPSAGTYTVWGEFKAGGRVVPTSFTVQVK